MDIVAIKYHIAKNWIWELASKEDQIKKACQEALTRATTMKFEYCKTKKLNVNVIEQSL